MVAGILQGARVEGVLSHIHRIRPSRIRLTTGQLGAQAHGHAASGAAR